GGDVLNYMAGPKWSMPTSKRWIMQAQVLIGGTKITHVHTDLAKKSLVNQRICIRQAAGLNNLVCTRRATDSGTLYRVIALRGPIRILRTPGSSLTSRRTVSRP